MTLEEFDNHLAWKDASNGGAERTMLQNEMRMTLIEKKPLAGGGRDLLHTTSHQSAPCHR